MEIVRTVEYLRELAIKSEEEAATYDAAVSTALVARNESSDKAYDATELANQLEAFFK